MPEGEEGVRLAIEALPEERRKQARHGCGYALWVEAINCVGDSVIVDHRSAEPGALPLVVWHCPGCGAKLRLWWPVEVWVARMTV